LINHQGEIQYTNEAEVRAAGNANACVPADAQAESRTHW
jgi:hypothetical protein